MGLETEIAAWLLDETCLIVGRKIEKEMADGKNPFVNSGSAKVNQKSNYAAFGNRPVKKIKIPESGIW